jgi:pimeloyl-ACP methyl ester carboxylesterase
MGVIRAISRGTALAGAVIAGGALAITASSVIATPQPLESALEGERHLFRFREGDVFYTVRGPASAPPVLLLHSVHLSASSFEWRKNLNALSQSFRVYAPDLLGFGLSDRPAINYNADVYVHLVSDFVREVIAQPTIVVARNHSAAFAVRAAYLDSRFFTRLIFLSPTGILPHDAEEERDWAVKSGDTLQRLLRSISGNTAGQVPFAFLTTRPALSWLVARQSYANPELVTPDVVDHLYATTHQFGARFAPLAFMSGKLDTDVLGTFADLPQPILLVWGAQDAINHPTHAEALTALNPHTRLEVIERAGNAVQEEQADEVNELLHAWCLAPAELVDPALREREQIPNAAAAPAPVEEAAPAPAATTAAPLTTPRPETTEQAAEEELLTAEVEAPTYVEAERDESVATATPPAANAGAAPEPFAVADTRIGSEAAEEEAAAEARPAAETPKPSAAAPQQPSRQPQKRPASKATGARANAPGQAQQNKAARSGTGRDSARQARSTSGDKPQPPRSSGGPKKKS